MSQCSGGLYSQQQPCLSCCWRMSLGRMNRTSSTPFFSVRVSENKSFTKVENGVLVSLGNKGTGAFQVMKRLFLRLEFTEELSLQSVGSTNSSSGGWAMAQVTSGATLGARVSLSLSGTSKSYSSNSLGLLAPQVDFPSFNLNHILHLSQQLTPDEEEGLCFGYCCF